MSGIVLSLAASATDNAAQPPKVAARDGQHDFDFNIGVWKTHIRRILDPLSGSADSIELEGTVTVRKVWDGRAQLEEIEADGPKGHWEGLTLFLYNPDAHQWSQSFANSKSGVLISPLIGEFKNGRGDRTASTAGRSWSEGPGPISARIPTILKNHTRKTVARLGRRRSLQI
jgi:hypothetical protein